MKSQQYEIGMVGLGVMGRNLVLNMADQGAVGNSVDVLINVEADLGKPARAKAKASSLANNRVGEHDEHTSFVAEREIPPVVDAITAVRVQIVKDVKYSKGRQ